jgi:hypothetical protein
VGKVSRDHLRERRSHTIKLSEIEINAPPGGTRDLFLAELQYEGGLEDEINLHEDGLAERLAKAFLRHPRVASVERVTIGPGKEVHVELHYRVPVLAVEVNGVARTIDAEGVLLPPGVRADGLLVLKESREQPLPPLVDSGNTWADRRMLAASRTAAFLAGDAQLGLGQLGAARDGDCLGKGARRGGGW